MKTLTEQDLIIGGKYVPHSKSVGCELEHSNEWNKNGGKEQGFLYYKGENEVGDFKFGVEFQYDYRADFFLPSDVTPYIEPVQPSADDILEQIKLSILEDNYTKAREIIQNLIDKQ